jgi:hypothetical protein
MKDKPMSEIERFFKILDYEMDALKKEADKQNSLINELSANNERLRKDYHDIVKTLRGLWLEVRMKKTKNKSAEPVVSELQK